MKKGNFKQIIILQIIFSIFAFCFSNAQVKPNFGSASNFGLLAGGSVLNTDTVSVLGNFGSYSSPDSTVKVTNGIYISGSSNFVNSLIYLDSLQAFCSGQYGTTVISTDLNDTILIGGGVYNISNNLDLNTKLTLEGDSGSVFIFNISDSMIVHSDFFMALHGVTIGNIIFNIGASFISNQNCNLSGSILVSKNAIINRNFYGSHSLLCGHNVTIDLKANFISSEELSIPDFNFLFFERDCGLKFVQESHALNQRINGPVNNPLTNPGFSQPVNYSVTMPANSQVVQAYFWFMVLSHNAIPTPFSVTITDYNGNTSTVTSVDIINTGTTQEGICWESTQYALSRTTAYRIDMTPFIMNGNGIPQTYTFSNLPSTLPGSSIYDTEGGTLFVVYKDNNTGQQEGTILLHDGLWVNENEVNPTIINMSNVNFAPVNQVNPNESSAFMLMADIEAPVSAYWPDERFIMNNIPIGIAASNTGIQMWHFVQQKPIVYNIGQTSIDFTGKKAFGECFAIQVLGAYYRQSTSGCGNYSFAGPDISICLGDGPVQLNAAVTGGTSYSWSPATGLSATNIHNPTSNLTTTTTYTVTVGTSTGPIVDNITITVNPLPPVPIISYISLNGCLTDGHFYIGSNDIVPGIVYSWTATFGSLTQSYVGTDLYNGIFPSPLVPFNTLLGGQVTFFAYDPATGCKSSSSILIYPCCENTGGLDGILDNEVLTNESMWPYFVPNSGHPSGPPYILNTNPAFPAPPFSVQSLTVTQDLAMLNINLMMMPDAVIIIKAGVTLELNGCHLYACNDMWKWIYLEAGAKIRIINCFIEDAKNAVYSDQGPIPFPLQHSNILIINSRFDRNYVCIHAENDDFSSSVIYGNNFICSGYSLHIPHLTERTFKGIVLRNTSNIKIGNESGYAFANTFDNMDYGIFSERSNSTIVNNYFKNIDDLTQNSCAVQYRGTAIRAHTGTYNITIGGQLFLGGINFRGNTFENCKRGIMLSDRVTSSISWNLFDKITLYGINTFQANFSDIDIHNNEFYDCNFGV